MQKGTFYCEVSKSATVCHDVVHDSRHRVNPHPSHSFQMIRSMRKRLIAIALVIISQLALEPCAHIARADLSNLSLEELANTPVVRTSKQSERLFDAAASAFIFDEEAIRYLPVDSIPELLRYAPGMNVMRSSNGVWGVGIRGTNIRYFSRSLFNIDEQNLYGGIFAGLFGSQHDIPMDDIASIEVVYGSGGSIWSTNAVNGMINVILKSTFETEESLLKTQYGSQNRKWTARTGWAVSDRTSARVFGSYGVREANDASLLDDRWETSRVGFQTDTRFSSQDLLTLSGEAYRSMLGEARIAGMQETGSINPIVGNEEQEGYNVQAKWTHQDSSEQGYSLRTWAGFSEFDSLVANFTFKATGLEFRGRSSLSEQHQLVYSSTFATNKFDFNPHPFAGFTRNANKTGLTGNASVQYDYALIPDVLRLSSGITAQYDNGSGRTEFLPSIRAIYHVDERTRIWAAYSRVFRVIPQAFRDADYIQFLATPIPPVTLPTPMGDLTVDRLFIHARSAPDIKSEQLDSFELGYRIQFSKRSELRLNTFFNRYKNLISIIGSNAPPELRMGSEALYFVQYLDLANAADATAWGGEISLQTELTSQTSILLNYAYLHETTEFYPVFIAGPSPTAIQTLGISPRHQASMWVSRNWPVHFRTDLGIRFSSSYANLLGEQNAITELDARITWILREYLNFSLVGRNLLHEDINANVHRDLLTQPSVQGSEWYLELKMEF